MLQHSLDGIAKHTNVVKELIVAAGEKASKEHCKGMEGLVAEATKHCIEEALKKGPLLDAIIIAQYPTHDALRHRRVRHRRCLCQGTRQK